MPAATVNLVIEQKATYRKYLVYRDKLKKAINLTGLTAHMQIRTLDGEIIHDLSTENGGITLGGTTGKITLTIPLAITRLMSFASALYDLKLISADGSAERLLQGKVTLSLGQTDE